MSRRALALGGTALAVAGLVSAAPAETSRPLEFLASSPDAELVALRARRDAALRDVNRTEIADHPLPGSAAMDLDAWVSKTGEELEAACEAIVYAPAAETAEGRALKAAAAMHQLRFAYCAGGWPGSGEELAWDVLSELAGDFYVSVELPEHLRANCEPERV